MTDFKAKMHQIPRWGSLVYSAPDLLAGFGGASRQGEGMGWGRWRKGEGEGEGSEREGPMLLLNQGPSEPCYATECCRDYSLCWTPPLG